MTHRQIAKARRCSTALFGIIACTLLGADAPSKVSVSPVPKFVPPPVSPKTGEHPTVSLIDNETREQRDARMAWWREAKFGMFIHWGIYSVPAGSYRGKLIDKDGAWIMDRGNIPVATYAAYAKQFNPVKFDATEWVRIAKSAGMRYIVITAKHHDGFAMFPSRASTFNIHDATPFPRDPLAELSAACRKEGVRFGLYYSQAMDWHNPGGQPPKKGWWDPAQHGDMMHYIQTTAAPQVREILSNYGTISELWFDMAVNMNSAMADQILCVVKATQPGVLINNRLGGGCNGDFNTPEQYIPSTGYPGRDWETCMTINDTWGFKNQDTNWKSAGDLIRKLIDICHKGGNFLLNVGPDAQGVIPPASVERLATVGRVGAEERRGHLRHHGQSDSLSLLGALYATRRCTLLSCVRLADQRRTAHSHAGQGDRRASACQAERPLEMGPARGRAGRPFAEGAN